MVERSFAPGASPGRSGLVAASARRLNGEENCRFVARVYGEDVDRVVESTREFADLGTYFYMPIRTYSSGMRARLAFGLSMAVDFDIYLVDEVTAVGDVHFQEKCRRAFEDRRERSSVIIVSHSLATIHSYCTQCAVLNAGKLSGLRYRRGSSQDVRRGQRMSSAPHGRIGRRDPRL